MPSEESTTIDNADLSSLVSSASLVLVGSLFGSFSKLFEQIVLGNVLSEAAYGDVNAGISLLTLCSILAMLGFGQGVPRFMSRFESERDFRGVWVTGVVLAGAVSVALAGVLLAGGGWLNRTLLDLSLVNQPFFGASSWVLPALFILTIPSLVVLNMGFGAIRGLGNTIYRTYSYDLLYNGIRTSLMLILLFGVGVGAVAAGYAYVVAATVAAVVAHLFLNRLLPLSGPFRTHTRAMLRFSIPLVVASAVSTLFGTIDTLMLNTLATSAETGIYNYGYQLAAGLPVVLSVFGFLYMPLASRLDADENYDEVDRIYKVTTKWIYIAVFPVFLTFVAFSDDLVSAVFGSTDPAAAMALAILSIGFFTSAANGRCQDTLSAFGYTRAILVINTVAAAINLVLNLVLIPRYGVVGAAVASALSFVSLNVIAMVTLWWYSGISPFSGLTVRTFLVLPIVLFPPAFLLANAVTLSIVVLPVFAILAGLVAVTLVAVTGCLQSEDEVPIELVEGRLGFRIPLIRRYIPDEP